MSTFSSLTSRTLGTRKYSSRNGKKIERMIIHHTAGGSNASNGTLLSSGARKVSSNYLLQTDAVFVGIVPEEYRAWTSGSHSADGNSITIETVNTGGPPTWPVSEKQVEALAQLAADLSTRYGWGKLNRNRVMGHREFANTTCPGPFLWPRLDWIIKRANGILEGKSSITPPKSTPSPAPPKTGVSKSVSDMATEVIAGKHGNGHNNRRRSLGISASEYAKVRAEVNRRTLANVQSKSSPAPKRANKSISDMATEVIAGKHGNGHENRRRSLGISASEYAKVRAEVNRRVNSGGRSQKSISDMASEVIAGKHGNGHDNRRRSLGVSSEVYARVRAEVNRRV